MRNAIILSFILSLPVWAAEKGPFDGKWVADSETALTEGTPDIRELQIKQKGNEIVIKSKYVEPRNGIYPLLWLGVMAYELKLNADGSDTVNLLGPYKHQSKTTVEGLKMTTQFQAANEAGEAVSGQWIRSVSEDGKQLTCQIQTKASDGRTLDQTLTFRRK